jgi:transcriptional regulator with XRE-family HTH domain
MNRLKQLREQKGILQADLAKTLGISQATLSNWERGIHDIDSKSLATLSRLFGCSIDFILANSTNRHAADNPSYDGEIDHVYYRIAQDAKESGITPHDLQLLIDVFKRAQERDKHFS